MVNSIMAENRKTGHRQRLRERFLAGSPEEFSDEMLLELLLTFVIGRMDVRPLAQELVQIFGNLDHILSASSDELYKVKGLGQCNPTAPSVYPLYEDWGFTDCISVLYLAPPGSDIDNTSVGSFYPAKLLAQLKERKINWGILTDGARWQFSSFWYPSSALIDTYGPRTGCPSPTSGRSKKADTRMGLTLRGA